MEIEQALMTPPMKLNLAIKNGNLTEFKRLVEEGHVDPRSEAAKDPHLGAAPLYWACEQGHLDIVMYLVEEKKCDTMSKNMYGDAPLHGAALRGKLHVMRYLIGRKGCDAMSSGWEGRTPLHCACRNGHLNVSKFLIVELGVYPSCRDDNDSTPLHAAAQFGTLEVAKFLIDEQQCDVRCKNKSGGTVLAVAALGGKLDTVKYLINEKGCDPMCRGLSNRTPLHYACGFGHLHVVKYFVDDLKVDPMCLDSDNATPLHLAAQFGTLKLVKYLVEEKKCDVMCRGQYGRTPLHYACRNKDVCVAIYMIEDQKVDSSCRDADDSTPLHISAQLGSLEIVKYLIEEKKCDTMCRDKHKKTPLDAAAVNGRLDTVHYLISEKGCDPMCRGGNGRVCIHWACQSGHVDIVKYLVHDQGVDPLCCDDNGVTTLHIAALCGHVSVVQLLVQDYHCDPSVTDKYGNVPLDVARQYNKESVISFLSAFQKSVSNDLRSALVTRLKPYTRSARPTGVELGTGTYGSVIELIHCGEKVAGKKFKISSAAQVPSLMEKLCGEMILMMQIHHPNIVESKGVCFLANHPLPVLLMERLMCSLHAYLLDPSNTNMPLLSKFSVLYNVADGLHYLHNHIPVIIHRDLTAKNVLLNRGLNAKICDFGNSRVIDLDPTVTPETFTGVPGTLDYMPPEAYGVHTEYDPSLDIFSFGHLALFTIIQSTIKVLPPTYSDVSGLHPRSEVKRRSESLSKVDEMLGSEHKLIHLLKMCLHNRPPQRPRTDELMKHLQTMISSSESTEHLSALDILAATPRLSQLMIMHTPQGKKVKIIESVASEWRKVCTLLEFDAVGHRLKIIAIGERDRPEECCQAMFQHWLEGNGVPATWSTLIGVLEDCELNSIALEIKEALQIVTDADKR